MSGVLIKMGIYGLVRITSLFPHPPVAWGAVLLALGIVSGVLGVAYALGQHDLKRLLAYHSVENIGIIVMGIGLALIGRSLNRYDWIVLGLCAHCSTCGIMRCSRRCCFLSAGSVIHATHTREIDHLGGLAKTMPCDGRTVSDRRRGHLWIAAAQWICQRVLSLLGILFDGSRNRQASLRRHRLRGTRHSR